MTPRRHRIGGAIERGPFPDTAEARGGELTIGGVPAAALAAEHGTPLVVYCEETIRARARAYRDAAPDALVVYGTKAFPNVAVMRVLAEEGAGADVSTLGELCFALRAGLRGERLLFHGNNKSDEELGAAADAGALVVLDALEEVERAREAGVRRVLVRLSRRSRRRRTRRSRPRTPSRSSAWTRTGCSSPYAPHWPTGSTSRGSTSTSARS